MKRKKEIKRQDKRRCESGKENDKYEQIKEEDKGRKMRNKKDEKEV